MSYLGSQPNNIKQNIGLYTPSDILQLTKEGSWGGSLELIQSQNFTSSVSNIDFTSIKGTEYDVHFLSFDGLSHTVAGVSLFSIRYSTDGGSSFISTNSYQNAYQSGDSGGTFQELKGTESGLRIGFSHSSTFTSGYVYLYNLNNSARRSFNTFHSVEHFSAKFTFGQGVYDTANTVNAIRVYDAYNFDSGTVKLFGVKQI